MSAKQVAKRERKSLGLVFAFGLIVVGGLFLYQGIRSVTDNKISLITRAKILTVEQAKTTEETQIGLSGRSKLEGIDGMLFYFTEASTQNCFWMKDTLIPLDMVFVNEQKKIVTLHENVQPESYPQTFCPTEPVLYGIEVPAGKAVEWRMTVGEDLSWR
jgi:uncharacterized membrane protein (UPF0127 family)